MLDAQTLRLLRTAVEREPGLIRGTDQLEHAGHVYHCATGSLPYRLRDCAGKRGNGAVDRATLLWAQAVNDRFSVRRSPDGTPPGWSFGVEDMVERRAHVLHLIDDQLAVCDEHDASAAPHSAPTVAFGTLAGAGANEIAGRSS